MKNTLEPENRTGGRFSRHEKLPRLPDADALEPVLRETIALSGRAAAEEIERRGLSMMDGRTVLRARARLGLG